jgi:HEPN domain-containing protein
MNKGTDLLLMAKKDMAALAGMINDTVHFSDEIFGFHAEQAIEKALNAWIASLGKVYPFTHDLSLLLKILEKNGIVITGWFDLLELNSFGVQFRYEEFEQNDEMLNRKMILARVGQLIKTVEAAGPVTP